MFYLPKVLKRLDGWWMERCVTPVLRRWQRERPIDLIDAHFGYPEGVGCFRAGRRLGIPVFITLRGVESVLVRERAIGPQIVEALRGCAGVIAVSQSLKNAAVAAGVDADRIAVIPNAVDETVFHPGERAAARQGLSLPAGAPVVISVGHLLRGKGYHVLLPAFAKVRAARPEARLVIVGGPSHEPAYPARIQRQIRELALEQAVVMPGAVPPGEVARWLQAADVFALASYREGCCNAVLEALACGLPVVTTPVGDNERYVAPPRHGLIVPVENADALAGAMLHALAMQWDRGAIAASVLSRGWVDVASAVVKFFESRLAHRVWTNQG
jgi:glycosyltransferase involved in cell wall biosynthesis